MYQKTLSIVTFLPCWKGAEQRVLPCISSYSLSCSVLGRKLQSSPSAQVCSLDKSSGLVPEVSVPRWSTQQRYLQYQRLREDTAGQCGSLLHSICHLFNSSLIMNFLRSFPASNAQINNSMRTHQVNNRFKSGYKNVAQHPVSHSQMHLHSTVLVLQKGLATPFLILV